MLRAVGIGARPTGAAAPCCGALHTHAGLGDDARSRAAQTIGALDDGRPVVVDSAGCGAAMKDFGHLLGSDRARDFAGRVVDISELVADHIDRLPGVEPLPLRVAIQDPCHLRHAQRVIEEPRLIVSAAGYEPIEIDGKGLCCGAAGMYVLSQPETSDELGRRKADQVRAAGATLVASANPGCEMQLRSHLGPGYAVRHPIELYAEALRAQPATREASST